MPLRQTCTATTRLTESFAIVRVKGSRNAGFEERRAALLQRLRARLRERGAAEPTLRDFAAACDCSVSTLKHYFGRRQDIVLAIFADTHARAEAHLARVRQPSGPLEESVRDAVTEAWTVLADRGAARMLAAGMAEGMGDATLGPGYLNGVFDPYIRALTDRLAAHIARGEMLPGDPRLAALTLASPLLLAAIHQNELDGIHVWPIDQAALTDHVTQGFLRAYAASPEAGPSPGAPPRPLQDGAAPA